MDSAFWEEAWRCDAGSVMVAERVLQAELESLRPGSALDLGCGSGENAMMLAGAGWRVTGVDCSARAIALARDAARVRGLDLRFLCRDFTTWQPESRHDLVISTYALPPGAVGQGVLRMAARALVPGGTLLVAEWDRSMGELWGVAADEFTTAEALVAAVPGLIVEEAGLRCIPDMFADSADPRAGHGAGARVAFLRARSP